MAKTKKKTIKAKKSTAPSLAWPQMHTRVSASNQKFLHGVKKAADRDVIFILDTIIGEARKAGIKKFAMKFAKPAKKRPAKRMDVPSATNGAEA